jgi:serine/threonine protein phosphatase PrpC
MVIGWVGDSRAYWVDTDGTRQLTVDDSFAEEGVAKGLLTREQHTSAERLVYEGARGRDRHDHQRPCCSASWRA